MIEEMNVNSFGYVRCDDCALEGFGLFDLKVIVVDFVEWSCCEYCFLKLCREVMLRIFRMRNNRTMFRLF